jgi:hypothetical protein
MNDQDDTHFKNRILDEIKSGKVAMHSKTFLVWRATLWILALCLLAAVGIFIVSFMTFIVQANGSWDLPRFGLHGLREFIAIFPWLFVPALLLFIWLMERFVLHYTFAYRIPVLYSAIIVVFIIVLGSIIVLATPFHRRLYESAQREHLPIAGGIYRFFGNSRPDDFYVGTVTSIDKTTYSLTTPEGQTLSIITNGDTQLWTNSPIAVGDCLEVIGDRQQNSIIAHSIKKSDGSIVMRCHGPHPSRSPSMGPDPTH